MKNYLNVIDISSWQSGMNLATMYSANKDLDSVIVKTTGGVSYVQQTADPWIQWLISNGKPWGFYHYLDDDYRNSTGKAEAQFFVKNCKNYFKHGIPFADYEHPATYKGTAYLKDFLDEVYRLTGVKCGVYCSLSIVQSQDFSKICEAGYPLWLAQYASMNPTGFQEYPWQRGSYAPYKSLMMHQYTSSGYLNGWKSRLDLNKFFGTLDDWNKYVQGDEAEPVELKPADPKVVMAVLSGEYGCGNERTNALRSKGYDPESVQEKINQLYSIADQVKAVIKGNEGYLGCISQIAGNS